MSVIACGSLCFTRVAFEQACAQIAHLGFKAMDIAVMENWAHFHPSQFVADVDVAIQSAKSALEKHGLTPVAFNASAGVSEPSQEFPRFQAICRFANALNVSVVCYSAPMEAAGLDRSLRRYERLRDIAVEHNVTLAVEAHARTLLERVEAAVQFCEQIGELYLTLDPSHMVAGPNQGQPFDALYPYVRHTHWRDGGDRWERVQLPVGQGLVDFETVIEGLRDVGYDGAYAVEYIDTFPNGTRENIVLMKQALETHLGAGAAS